MSPKVSNENTVQERTRLSTLPAHENFCVMTGVSFVARPLPPRPSSFVGFIAVSLMSWGALYLRTNYRTPTKLLTVGKTVAHVSISLFFSLCDG